MSHDSLIEAIENGEGERALALLEADPGLCTKDDQPSALMLALYRAQFHIAEVIAERRVRLSLFEAAAIGDEKALTARLATDGAVDAVAADGFMPIHLACFFGRERVARMLLDAGADPNALVEETGLRPLHSAAAGRSLPIVEALLAAGADPNRRQQGGYTALHAAAMQGDAEMVAALLEAGADPAATEDDGRAAADFARSEGHGDLAERLAALNPASSALPRS